MASFPEKLIFQAVPQHIEAASHSLPKPKGSIRRARVNIDDFRKRLLDLPIEKLGQWKLKPAAQEYLPYIAAEKSNDKLQKSVAILVLACFDQLQTNCIYRILLSMYDHPEICKLAQQRLQTEERPPWLSNLETLDPRLPQVLAQQACDEHRPLHDLLKSFEIPSWSALGTAVYAAIPKCWNAHYLMRLPAAETLNWIAQSSGTIVIRSLLMKALLRRYGSCIPDPQWIQPGKPLGNLIRTAMRIWPYPSAIWTKMPKDAAKAAHWISIEQQLKQHLNSHERDFWKLAIHDIRQIIWLPNDHILLFELPNLLVLQRTDQWLIRPKSELSQWHGRNWKHPAPLSKDLPWQDIPETVNECMTRLQQWTAS